MDGNNKIEICNLINTLRSGLRCCRRSTEPQTPYFSGKENEVRLTDFYFSDGNRRVVGYRSLEFVNLLSMFTTNAGCCRIEAGIVLVLHNTLEGRE